MMDDFLNYLLQQFILTINRFSWVNGIEILIILIILWVVYCRFIKGTQSENIVKGSFILIFAWIFSIVLEIFQLNILGMFLKSVVIVVSLSLIVIFQPELRKILGYFGQMEFFHGVLNPDNENEEINVIKEIIETAKYLSKSHTGALMVFQKDLSNTYTNVGTILNADLSMELLLTIFHINTPLHDGAVVINGKKIISAGVLLPLTEDPKLSWKYGTRHRAAIGMSEQSDAICLVISEETGDISIAIDGILKKYDDIQNLKSDLENLLIDKTYTKPANDKKLFNFDNLTSKSEKEQQ